MKYCITNSTMRYLRNNMFVIVCFEGINSIIGGKIGICHSKMIQ